jgi:phage gp36-like protein
MYVEQQGMIDRYGEAALIQLTDRGDPPIGAIDATVLAKALADAAELIHGYCRSGGYAVPFAAPAPNAVAQWQAGIAYYFLHNAAAEVTEKLTKDFDRAVAQLKDVAKGVFKLEAAGVPAPAAQDETVLLDAPDREYSREKLEGF